MRDPEEIGRRLLRPIVDAKRVAEVQGVLAGLGSVSAALEACIKHGLMPDAWWSNPSRAAGVACSICGGRSKDEAIDSGVSLGMWPCPTCNGTGKCDREWTIELVTAIACDPPGIAVAEELGMEASCRMTPDGPSTTTEIRWSRLARRVGLLWLETRGVPTWLEQHAWYGSMQWRFSDEAAALRSKVLSSARRDGGDHAIRAAADHVAFELEWTLRASDGQQPFASMTDRNPFTPIVDLWLSGYALEAIAPASVYLATSI